MIQRINHLNLEKKNWVEINESREDYNDDDENNNNNTDDNNNNIKLKMSMISSSFVIIVMHTYLLQEL